MAVILVSLALVLSAFVALWALGVISRSVDVEILEILPNASLNTSSGELSIFLHNRGGVEARVVGIAVQERPCSPRQPSTSFPIAVGPGELVGVKPSAAPRSSGAGPTTTSRSSRPPGTSMYSGSWPASAERILAPALARIGAAGSDSMGPQCL